jgi:hypothetical protein
MLSSAAGAASSAAGAAAGAAGAAAAQASRFGAFLLSPLNTHKNSSGTDSASGIPSRAAWAARLTREMGPLGASFFRNLPHATCLSLFHHYLGDEGNARPSATGKEVPSDMGGPSAVLERSRGLQMLEELVALQIEHAFLKEGIPAREFAAQLFDVLDRDGAGTLSWEKLRFGAAVNAGGNAGGSGEGGANSGSGGGAGSDVEDETVRWEASLLLAIMNNDVAQLQRAASSDGVNIDTSVVRCGSGSGSDSGSDSDRHDGSSDDHSAAGVPPATADGGAGGHKSHSIHDDTEAEAAGSIGSFGRLSLAASEEAGCFVFRPVHSAHSSLSMTVFEGDTPLHMVARSGGRMAALHRHTSGGSGGGGVGNGNGDDARQMDVNTPRTMIGCLLRAGATARVLNAKGQTPLDVFMQAQAVASLQRGGGGDGGDGNGVRSVGNSVGGAGAGDGEGGDEGDAIWQTCMLLESTQDLHHSTIIRGMAVVLRSLALGLAKEDPVSVKAKTKAGLLGLGNLGWVDTNPSPSGKEGGRSEGEVGDEDEDGSVEPSVCGEVVVTLWHIRNSVIAEIFAGSTAAAIFGHPLQPAGATATAAAAAVSSAQMTSVTPLQWFSAIDEYVSRMLCSFQHCILECLTCECGQNILDLSTSSHPV